MYLAEFWRSHACRDCVVSGLARNYNYNISSNNKYSFQIILSREAAYHTCFESQMFLQVEGYK